MFGGPRKVRVIGVDSDPLEGVLTGLFEDLFILVSATGDPVTEAKRWLESYLNSCKNRKRKAPDLARLADIFEGLAQLLKERQEG